MSKIGLIIKREYITRVRKKSFLVMTLLGPVLFASVVFLPALLATTGKETRRVVVVDKTNIFCGILNSTNAVAFDYSYCNFDTNQVRNLFADSSKVSVLYIPANLAQGHEVFLYSKTDPNPDVASDISYELDNIMERSKMKKSGLNDSIIAQVKTDIKVSTKNTENHDVNTDYSLILGMAGALLIYLFIFMYSIQVMRGVMEEKINRIVEIIITSVKPFQLMMGKVVGVCMVGLTQFLIWVIVSVTLYNVGSNMLQSSQINPSNARTEQTVKTGISQRDDKAPSESNTISKSDAVRLGAIAVENIERTNWPLIVGCFIFYFLAGYMLYSSFFAAIGSAVDQETETQQFMLPVTIPLILSIVILQKVIVDPQGPIAVWFSIIPLTSPITMMARIPFGIPVWQLLLSMGVLILTIIGTIWLAGRIYRVGLLMYGKKITYRELGKWLFYK